MPASSFQGVFDQDLLNFEQDSQQRSQTGAKSSGRSRKRNGKADKNTVVAETIDRSEAQITSVISELSSPCWSEASG